MNLKHNVFVDTVTYVNEQIE